MGGVTGPVGTHPWVLDPMQQKGHYLTRKKMEEESWGWERPGLMAKALAGCKVLFQWTQTGRSGWAPDVSAMTELDSVVSPQASASRRGRDKVEQIPVPHFPGRKL